MLHRVRFQQIHEVSSLDSGHPKHVLIPLVPTTPSECNERELRSVRFPRYFVHTQVNRISVSVRRNKVYPLMPRTLHVDGICGGICGINLFSLVWLRITMLDSTQALHHCKCLSVGPWTRSFNVPETSRSSCVLHRLCRRCGVLQEVSWYS